MRKQVEESTAAESARRATGAAAERDRRGRDKAVHPRTIARDAVARPPRLLGRPARRVSPPRPRGLALSWRGSTGRLDAVPTAPLPLRLPAQRGAQLCGALRIRARRALALAQLKPGVEAAAHGERHAQTQRLARSAARLHPEVGRPARPALPPVKPVPHLKLVGLRRVDRRVSHQRRGVLAAPQRLDAAVGRAPARPEPHRQPAPVRGRGDGQRPAEPPFLVRGVLMGQ